MHVSATVLFSIVPLVEKGVLLVLMLVPAIQACEES